jgi:hypothetical protein
MHYRIVFDSRALQSCNQSEKIEPARSRWSKTLSIAGKIGEIMQLLQR